VASVVQSGQAVTARIISIDIPANRISLTMRPEGSEQRRPARGAPRDGAGGDGDRPARGKVATRGGAARGGATRAGSARALRQAYASRHALWRVPQCCASWGSRGSAAL